VEKVSTAREDLSCSGFVHMGAGSASMERACPVPCVHVSVQVTRGHFDHLCYFGCEESGKACCVYARFRVVLSVRDSCFGCYDAVKQGFCAQLGRFLVKRRRGKFGWWLVVVVLLHPGFLLFGLVQIFCFLVLL
jgi:hypothetical protein